MNIIFYATFPNPSLPESPRGGYRRNVEMLRLLALHHDLHLLVSARNDFHMELPFDAGVQVVAGRRLPARWLKGFRALHHLRRPDSLVICYNPSLHALPALWCRWLGAPLVVDYVDLQGTTVESTNLLLRGLGKVVEWLFVHSCSHFITSSAVLAQRIQAQDPRAQILMYRGTLHRDSPDTCCSSLPHVLPDTTNIMYLGLMHHFAGVRELLQAFADLHQPNAHLYLVGHGPLREECLAFAQRLAPQRIAFPELNDDALHPFMAQMDVLVLPYLDMPRNRVNFPSKIIEYLWAGKAILATNVGEIARVLRHGETALVVPPTQAGLTQGLRQLLSDSDLRRRLGTNARADFEQHYSENVAAAALEAFLDRAQARR